MGRAGTGAVGDPVDRTGALHEAQKEIRQLRSTIAALRAQLEETHAGGDAAVQRAVAAGRDEVRQLQATVAALRDEMQAILLAKDAAVEATRAAGQDEARQLQATIATLREGLETKRGD